ncbi:hypothetical protein [Streptomyces massasporeus]|uniref:hypothetical protein n=1 Tax=Streptomyces massasporeus TaxID=67324 RepID=UPI00380BB0D8
MTWVRWAVGVSGWVAVAATMLPQSSPLRWAVTACFLLVCPGLAATLLWARPALSRGTGPSQLLESVLLTGAVSLALTALAAEALYLSNVFSVTRALLLLAVLCSVLVVAGAVRDRAPGIAGSPRRFEE